MKTEEPKDLDYENWKDIEGYEAGFNDGIKLTEQ